MKIKKLVTQLTPANNNEMTDVQDIASIHVPKTGEIGSSFVVRFLSLEDGLLRVAISLSRSGARMCSRPKGSVVGDPQPVRGVSVEDIMPSTSVNFAMITDFMVPFLLLSK